MKKSLTTLVLLVVIIFAASSCQSPFKKRKKCRGNGGWYGNRNLGAASPQLQKQHYQFKDSDFVSFAKTN